jgi:hypothetical protein
MNIKEIVAHLKAIAKSDTISQDEKTALEKAISILNKEPNWGGYIKVVDILVKLLGIGSNFFDI